MDPTTPLEGNDDDTNTSFEVNPISLEAILNEQPTAKTEVGQLMVETLKGYELYHLLLFVAFSLTRTTDLP